MGYCIDKNNYKFKNEKEMMNALGFDPDTIEGDYAEAYYHYKKIWDQIEIDNRFKNSPDNTVK